MPHRKLNSRKTAAVLRGIPFNSLLGMRITRLHRDGITIACQVTPRLLNLKGMLHGGVSATLADASTGVALYRHLGGRRAITTVELKISYFRPIAKGRVFARSHLLRVGATLCVARVDITDTHGHALATALVTYMVLDTAGQRGA
jgi:uncharacterized protein (TIGR00369 family)